ncbi:adenylate/guanylate cyclase domain-containing protein [Variovorax sp. J31P207]|uniref:adenylate/guanylate cyclase domain-containing protein n=1 Tax=Variovorax sp. J31P207 TaxID=3053510 RepID=UPI0025785D4C|nr:adenylate/guanylate cyclase domain-containing protein [Variovorax sp. J31P207]MDM0066562.1 adenylate/guanylate cyclase domain-containing protein [Variovorax sp. J31P207]
MESHDVVSEPGTDRRTPASGSSRVTRRQMTVLFCDVVGSTSLAERLDPEDVLDVLSAFGDLMGRVARSFGGHVARIVGDGADVYFGYPLASEDDAVRAVHAGLAIVEEAGRLHHTCGIATPVQVRVGIATGLVAVGAREGLAIAGSTPNLAARIQAVARPGQVTIAPGTRRIAGAQFEYQDLGDFELKGFDEPVRLTAVTGAGDPDGRSAWRGHDTKIPLVGREADIARLKARWNMATTNRRIESVLVVAEPGLGKSRLASGFDQQIASVAHTTVRLQCSPFHSNSILRPVVQHLVRAAGFARADSPALHVEKLDAQLAVAGIGAELDRRLIASLVEVDGASGNPPLDLPAAMQLQMTRNVLCRYFMGLATEKAPLLLIVEDLHWMDPTSFALLDQLLAGAQRAPMLVVLTSRPERPCELAAQPSLIRLGRLDEQASREVVTNMAASMALSTADIETIIRRSDGVPLFLEEMTRMLLDSRGRRCDAIARPPEVPDTLMDLLMERLDRLGSGKWLAQVAAVIGHEFSRRLLYGAAGMDPAAFNEALHAMLRAGLLLRVDVQGERFSFKHALIEDAAYGSIIVKTRAILHGRLADLLTSEFTEIIERQPEVAARHLSRALRPLEAGRYFLRAGEQALRRGAPREAAAHLSEGVSVLAAAPAGHERSEAELSLLSTLGPTTMVLTGPGSEAFRDVQQRAFTLCHELPGAPRQFPVTYGLCLYHWGRAELETARWLAEDLLKVADLRRDDAEATIAAHNMSGMIKLSLGDVRAARAHLERSVACYDPQRDASLYPVYLMDFGVFGRFYLALATLITGDEELAGRHVRDAHELAARANQPHTLGFSMAANCSIAVLRNQPGVARTFAQQCIDFCTQTGFSEFMGLARISRGWATARDGQTAAGLDDMEAGIRLWQATGFENWQSWFASLRADLLVEMGRSDEALAELDLHLGRMDRSGENLFRSVLLAQRAMLLDVDRNTRERLLAEATGIAAAQHAITWIRRIETRRGAFRSLPNVGYRTT